MTASLNEYNAPLFSDIALTVESSNICNITNQKLAD